jgi:hypothetical protein
MCYFLKKNNTLNNVTLRQTLHCTVGLRKARHVAMRTAYLPFSKHFKEARNKVRLILPV